jgi:hypothetical protein
MKQSINALPLTAILDFNHPSNGLFAARYDAIAEGRCAEDSALTMLMNGGIDDYE